MIFFLLSNYFFLKRILIRLIDSIINYKLTSKTITSTPILFKNLNNFKNVLYLIIDNVTTSNVINLNIIKS
jgi:hypothetical protein